MHEYDVMISMNNGVKLKSARFLVCDQEAAFSAQRSVLSYENNIIKTLGWRMRLVRGGHTIDQSVSCHSLKLFCCLASSRSELPLISTALAGLHVHYWVPFRSTTEATAVRRLHDVLYLPARNR